MTDIHVMPCLCGGKMYAWFYDEEFIQAWHCPTCGKTEKPIGREKVIRRDTKSEEV